MPYQYKREPLSDEETTCLINACESFQEKFIIWILLDTGMRVSELAGLTKQNIQWQERRIVVYGKGGKRRIIPMTDRVRKLIENHFTFQDKVGCSVRNIQRIVKIVANRASISKPVCPHSIRHLFAINAIRRGISTRSLMMFLGHDRLTTTEIYLNLSPEDAIREFQNKW